MAYSISLVRSKWAIGLYALIILGAGYWFVIRSPGQPYSLVPVTRGPIVETVSVTGNTAPMKSVALTFQGSGTIARVNYALGDRVAAGAVVASLTTASLAAAVQQAQANLAVAQANLAGALAGTRPEQLAIDQSAVTQDQAALANAIASAYAASDTAVHTNADPLFTNGRTASAALVITVPDANLASQVVRERIALEPVLARWNAEISASSFSSSDPSLAATQAAQSLMQVQTFLNDLAAAIAETQPSGAVTSATLSADQSAVAAARTSAASALATLTSAKTTLTSAQGAFALAQAGSTSQDIAAQQAQVAQAAAGVASAQANLANAEIVAPISGTITQLDAKVGQQATPGTPLVSIIGETGFEVDVGVADTDIGKLAVGDTATMTLDAFANETFTGKIFYIAPAETDTQGIVSYLVKLSFDKYDTRLKSGLTANIDIQARKDDDALILPQYAILQNDNGTFVELPSGTTTTTTPVTLGIQDKNGNVEVLSGVSEGEQVINIGLKTK